MNLLLDSNVLVRMVRGLVGPQLAAVLNDAWSVSALPRLHGDPFDRLLVAQALAEGLVLVTSDRKLADYGVAVLRT